jgi:hypothetical protein
MWSNENSSSEVLDDLLWWCALVVAGLITAGIALVVSLPVP